MDQLFVPAPAQKENRGMGLNIAKSIVDMYNGRIEWTATRKGVRILVELPSEGEKYERAL